jgi:hypothetical protein
VVVVRATLMLVRFEVTADLTLAEERRRALSRAHYDQQEGEGSVAVPIPTTHASATTPAIKSTINKGASTVASVSTTSPLSLWNPSWFTRQRRFTKGKHFWFIVSLIVGLYIIGDLSAINLVIENSPDATAPCAINAKLLEFRTILNYWIGGIPTALSVWFFVVWLRLRRHKVDSWV